MWLSLQCRAHSFTTLAGVSRIPMISEPGMVLDRQDAAVRLTRVVEIPRTMFWHAPGASHGCAPTRQFPLWK
eukprot:8455043-Pyramimonas_sp.AAC.1